MTPWLADPDVRLFHGDALEVLRELPDGSVHMCATSPPFWNLRDYNAPGQIGLEATPEDWTANLVAVFREVRRVLRDDGTLWVEIGDSYAHGQPGGGSVFDNGRTDGRTSYEADKPGGRIKTSTLGPGLKPKDLLGQPWLLAFALRADGWYWRDLITWSRPNPMPESVRDRTTKSASWILMFSKKPTYFYDQDAIRSPFTAGTANGTSPSGPALRPELRATLHTDDGATYTRGWHDLRKRQISVLSSVAADTNGFQIVELVGLEIGVETPEGDLVVNLEPPRGSAVDTRSVSVTRCLSLLSPVRASIADIAASPSGAALADLVGANPDAAALARAEVTALELAVVTDEMGAARLTLEGQEFRATLLVWGTARSSHRKNIPLTLDGSGGETPRGPDGRRVTQVTGRDNSEQHRDGERWPNPSGANCRSVWEIATEPTPFAHFATWPQALVRRMILAGTSERGACPECGAPWVRETERRGDGRAFQRDQDQLASSARRSDGSRLTSGTGHRTIGGTTPSYLPPEVTTTGWRPTCACSTETPAGSDALSVRGLSASGGEGAQASDLSGVPGLHGATSGWSPSCACKPPGSEGLDKPGEWEFTYPPVPCTVLDPFAGSGTTSLVARNHGRHSIGIELNQSYLEIAAKRLQQLSLLASPTSGDM